MQTPERERIRKAIVELVKASPGRYSRRLVLKKIGEWDQTYSTSLYKLFAVLEQADLVRYERATDGLMKVWPGRNAARFGETPTGGDFT
jgi:hypothetical protein